MAKSKSEYLVLNNQPKLFSCGDYREFLRDVVTQSTESGVSMRALARICGLKNPTFFQQVLAGQRNLTPAVAEKVADALKYKKHERAYLKLLVKLDNPRLGDKDKILEEMRALVLGESKAKVKDVSIHSHWLHGVIFEFARIPNFPITVDSIAGALRGHVSKQDIEKSLKFLLSKGWLKPTGVKDIYKQESVQFQVLDDVRRIDIQRSHLQYLEFAKHRINDDLNRREYRGLTVAMSQAKMDEVKLRIREFYRQLRVELDGVENSERIVRLQFCMFEIANTEAKAEVVAEEGE